MGSCASIAGDRIKPSTNVKQRESNFLWLFRKTLGECVIEDFELGNLLGKGSCGTVRVGKHIKSGKSYAIKILSIEQPTDLSQAMNEKELMLTIEHHPNIIRLEGSCQTETCLYLVQEFAEGGDVFTLLRKLKRFDALSAQFYTAQTVLALEHLHKHHIVYRDLKPENLVLDRIGNLKLTDFGYAKMVHGRTWTLCGTPEYLAPEVLRSEGYGSDVDWWCLGVLLYEFVVGYPPFFDENPSQLYSKILGGKVSFPKSVDVIGRNIVRQLLQSDRSMRLGSMVGGVGAIKAHPFFQGIDFALLAKMKVKPPLNPIAALAAANAAAAAAAAEKAAAAAVKEKAAATAVGDKAERNAGAEAFAGF